MTPPATSSASHRAEYRVFRLVEALTGLIPMEACAAIGRILGGFFRLVSPRYRRLVRRNLRIVTAGAPLPPEQLDSLIRETFCRAGANFLCGLHSGTLTASGLRPFFDLRGAEMLRRHDDQPGLLVALAHQGNWEVLVRLPALLDGLEAFGAVYRPLNNPLMDGLTHARRTADGARLFSRKDGFHAPIALLRTPGTLGVLADQRAGGRGEPLPFFGKMTGCSPLPALIVRRARAELATASLTSVADGKWRIEFRHIGRPSGTAEIMDALEQAMRRSLPDVFWFHDRWRIDSVCPLSFFARFDPEAARRATVPLRILLTTPEEDAEGARFLIDGMLAARPDCRIDWLVRKETSPPDPRVFPRFRDPTRPPEQSDGLLAEIDALHPAPLDAAILFGGDRALATSARRLGLRSILGLEVAGKPWTHSYEKPCDDEGWRRILEKIAYVPKQTAR